jgi:hypothetical protein
MPTNRKRRARNHRNSCPRQAWYVLIDDPLPPSDPDFNPFQIQAHDKKWQEYKDEVLKYWIQKHPCTRPSRFWRLEVAGPVPETQKEKLLYLKNNDFLTEYEQKTLKTAPKWAKKD